MDPGDVQIEYSSAVDEGFQIEKDSRRESRAIEIQVTRMNFKHRMHSRDVFHKNIAFGYQGPWFRVHCFNNTSSRCMRSRSGHFLKNVRYFMKYHIRKSLFSQISLSSFRSDKSDNSIYGSMDLISLGEGGKMFLSRENSRDLINQSKFNKRSVKSNPDPRRLRFASFPESGMDSESQPANQRLELKKKFSFHM